MAEATQEMIALAREIAANQNAKIGATLYAKAILRGELDHSADVKNALAHLKEQSA